MYKFIGITFLADVQVKFQEDEDDYAKKAPRHQQPHIMFVMLDDAGSAIIYATFLS